MMDTLMIQAARHGDERAASALVSRYGPRLRRTVVRWVEDADAADDLCQEAWVRAFRALPRFRGDADFGTWLHTIARNLASGRMRREVSRRDRLRSAAPPPSVTRPDPVELRIALERAVSSLPTGMRRVLILHDVEGWKHREIAASLGIAEGTSKSQLFKARAELRRRLKGGDGPGRAQSTGGARAVRDTRSDPAGSRG